MERDVASIITVTTAEGATDISTGKTKFFGANINSDGTNDVTVVIADDTTTKLTLKLDASLEGLNKPVFLPIPFVVSTNLTVTVTGTNGSADILYK